MSQSNEHDMQVWQNYTWSRDCFDQEKHLCFKSPSKIHTMQDLGWPEDEGIPSMAVSEPFELFTPEAIERMREEVLTDEVIRNCQYSSNLAQCQLRGYPEECAQFVHSAWKHPATLDAISKVAGVDLVTVMDYEIGHINVSVKTEEQRAKEARKVADLDLDEAAVGWHTDSYLFVCIVMLSDCTNMVGGETALRTADGEILKIRSPQKGSAIVLQGRYIEHRALKALGTTERITMVTSFRPRDPLAWDGTVLTTVRAVSDLPLLYRQFTIYRLEMLVDRIRHQVQVLQGWFAWNEEFDTFQVKAFLQEQEQFLAHTNEEIVMDDEVVKDEGGGNGRWIKSPHDENTLVWHEQSGEE